MSVLKKLIGKDPFISPRLLSALDKHLDTYKTGVLFNNASKIHTKSYYEHKIDGKDYILLLVREFGNYICLEKDTFIKAMKEWESEKK